MKRADRLHLKHEFVLRRLRVVSSQPIEPLRSAKLLDVYVFEESLEVAMPLTHVSVLESSNCLRAGTINVAKHLAFDLVVH
jgi:hypothetical protein